MAAYCVDTDLLLGAIPTPAGVSKTQFVQDAADEIDSYIGQLYLTPVNLEDPELSRPVKLLLKRLNVHLATGRLILAVTSNDEDDRLHAYGRNLIREALELLKAIAAGTFLLEGVPAAEHLTPKATTVLIHNEDAESSVEAFYNRVANPGYFYSGIGFAESESFVRRNSQNGIIR